ncbi:MAG: hypothetical protein ACM3UY_07095 [Methanocella sp.]
MNQPIYECPFCDDSAWRSRYLLWRHIHECLRKQQDYIQDLTPPTAPIKVNEKMTLTV